MARSAKAVQVKKKKREAKKAKVEAEKALVAESARKAIEDKAIAEALAKKNALKEHKLEMIEREARMNMIDVLHTLQQMEEIRKQNLKELRNIKAGEEKISKGENFEGSFLLLTFLLACGKKLAFIVEKKKDDSMHNSAYSDSVIQNFLPKGTPYTKPDTVIEFSSFSDMILCISDETSKYYKQLDSSSSLWFSKPCSITLYNTEVQYFTLADIGKIIKQHKRTYFGIVVMFQQILFSVFEKYFASHNIRILPDNTQSPFTKGETTRSQHDSCRNGKFQVSSYESDYYESDDYRAYCESDDRYCGTDCGECKACVGKDGAYNSFPVSWKQVCDSCDKTNEYQFQFKLAFDKNSGNYGIIDNTGYKQKFYNIQSILNKFDVNKLFGEQIFTETTCQRCTFESQIGSEIQKMTKNCSDVGIFVSSRHPIRYVIEEWKAKYIIPISIQFNITVYENYISVPCLDNDYHYHLQFWNIAFSKKMRYESILPFSIQIMFWVTLLSSGRYKIQLPSEIFEHIFGFIQIPEYDNCNTYILPFTGDINGYHMSHMSRNIPALLRGINARKFKVKGDNDDDDYYDDDL